MKHILKCVKCGEYTMKERCSVCDAECVSPKPVKYSPEDKYGNYRREVKKEDWIKRGLI